MFISQTFLFLLLVVSLSSQVNGAEKVFVALLTIDGAKNPETDAITPEGMHDLFLLGQQMRKRYVEDSSYLSSSFSPRETQIIASATSISSSSLNSFMLGFYPNETSGAYGKRATSLSEVLKNLPPKYWESVDEFLPIPDLFIPYPIQVPKKPEILLANDAEICPALPGLISEAKAAAIWRNLSSFEDVQRIKMFEQENSTTVETDGLNIFETNSSNVSATNYSSVSDKSELNETNRTNVTTKTNASAVPARHDYAQNLWSILQETETPMLLQLRISYYLRDMLDGFYSKPNATRMSANHSHNSAANHKNDPDNPHAGTGQTGLRYFKEENLEKPVKMKIYGGSVDLAAALLVWLNLTSSECVLKKSKGESAFSPCITKIDASSYLAFEMLKGDDGSYEIGVIHNGQEYLICSSTTQKTRCSLSEFTELVEKTVLGNEEYSKACGNNASEGKLPMLTKILFGLLLSSFCVFVLALLCRGPANKIHRG